jgi:hypothetical protein
MNERLTSEQIERLLSGSVSDDGSELGSLSRFSNDVRAAYARPVAADVRAAHIAKMTAAIGPAPEVPSGRRSRRRFALRTGAVAAGVVLAAGSAFAATGTLPDAAQDAVAGAASRVGLDLPRGHTDQQRTRPASRPERPTVAEENRSAAEAYTEAKQEWTDCVAENAPSHERSTPFDAEDACGPKPTPDPARDARGGQPANENRPTDRPGNVPPGEPRERARGEQGQQEADEHRPPSAGPPSNPGRASAP